MTTKAASTCSTTFNIKLDLSPAESTLLSIIAEEYIRLLAKHVESFRSVPVIPPPIGAKREKQPRTKDPAKLAADEFRPGYLDCRETGFFSSRIASAFKVDLTAIIKRYRKGFLANLKRVKPKHLGFPVINPAKLRFSFSGFKIQQTTDGFSVTLPLIYPKRTPPTFKLVSSDFHTPILQEFLTCDYTPTATIRLKDNNWWFSGTVRHKTSVPDTFSKPLGIDLGLAKLAVGYSLHNHKFASFEDTVEQDFRFLKEHRHHMTKRYQRHGRNDKVKDMKSRTSHMMQTINHTISKHIIDFALANQNDAIILEDLKNISQTDKAKGKAQKTWNRRIKGWTFFQLQSFIEYKAQIAGIKVLYVKPHNTSITCSRCGSKNKEYRVSQAGFHCTACEFSWNADLNAAKNIAARGLEVQAQKQSRHIQTEEPAAA